MSNLPKELVEVTDRLKETVGTILRFTEKTPKTVVDTNIAVALSDIDEITNLCTSTEIADDLLAEDGEIVELLSMISDIEEQEGKQVRIVKNAYLDEITDTLVLAHKLINEAYPEEETVEEVIVEEVEEKEDSKKEIKIEKTKEATTDITQPTNINLEATVESAYKSIEKSITVLIKNAIEFGIKEAGCSTQLKVPFTEPKEAKTTQVQKQDNGTANKKAETVAKKETVKKESDAEKIGNCINVKTAWNMIDTAPSFKVKNKQSKWNDLITVIKENGNKELKAEMEEVLKNLDAAVMSANITSAAIVLMNLGISEGASGKIIKNRFFEKQQKTAEKKTPSDVVNGIVKNYIKTVQIRAQKITDNQIADLKKLRIVPVETETDEAGWLGQEFALRILDFTDLKKIKETSEEVRCYLGRKVADITVDDNPLPNEKVARDKKKNVTKHEAHDNKVIEIAEAAKKVEDQKRAGKRVF